MSEEHVVYPGGPLCQPNCPGPWSMYHDGYADGYERALAASGATLDVERIARALREAQLEDWRGRNYTDAHEWAEAIVDADARLSGAVTDAGAGFLRANPDYQGEPIIVSGAVTERECVSCSEPSHDVDYHDHHYHGDQGDPYIGPSHAAGAVTERERQARAILGPAKCPQCLHTIDFCRADTCGCDVALALAASGATLDSCPCGHTDNEHVHYCSGVDAGHECDCNAEYARLSGAVTECVCGTTTDQHQGECHFGWHNPETCPHGPYIDVIDTEETP
jgi:hypothetical protein